MRITLGTFASSGMQAHAGADLQAGVRKALSHYTRKVESGRAPIGLPRFCREQREQEPEVSFDLAIEERAEALLEREAAKHGVPVDRLAAHAVLVYLADLDRSLAAPQPL